MADTKSKALRIGVLILSPSQLLDVAPIDLFGMLTHDYLSACRLPAPLVALAVTVEIHYIAATSSSASQAPSTSLPGCALVECTANAALRVTATVDDAAVAPGQLDVVLIPGPDPRMEPPEDMGRFIRGHIEQECVVMSVCTGIFPLAAAGVLKRRRATGPRALLGELRKRFPETVWVEERWCRDGNIWSSGGITNGLDMVAAYIKENYPGPLSDAVCAMADVGNRGKEYGSGAAFENFWWLWVILRAWFVGRKR